MEADLTYVKFYIVNLRGDSERWLRLHASLGGYEWVKPERVEGVYGSALPNDVCTRLTSDPYSVIAKGALGCLLSHVRAWELILANPDPWAFIGEDDASFSNVDCLRKFCFPEGVDFIFANDRTSPDPHDSSVLPELVEISTCLAAIARRRKAVGTDGYLISQAGASRLLSLFKKDGYFGHVDMRLLAYSVDSDELSELSPDENWLTNGIFQLKRVSGGPKALKTMSFAQSISCHEAGPETARIREDRIGALGVVLPQ